MKYFVCILFTLGSISLHSQTNNKDSIVKILKAKIELGQTNQKKLDSLNSELKNQLLLYKAKEDYFAVALEDQSNRFALIVTLIITLLITSLGVISFSWIRVERQKIIKQFKTFELEFLKIKEENDLMNGGLYETASNAHLLAAKSYRSDYPIKAFESNLLGVWESILSLKILKDKDFDTPIYNLKIALEIANEISNTPLLKDQLKERKDRIDYYINAIQDTKNDKIRDLCANIRVLIKR
jgi:hypothetical protein